MRSEMKNDLPLGRNVEDKNACGSNSQSAVSVSVSCMSALSNQTM